MPTACDDNFVLTPKTTICRGIKIMTALSDKTIKAMIDDGVMIVDPFDSA